MALKVICASLPPSSPQQRDMCVP